MDAIIPSPEEVKSALQPLGYAEMQELSRLSGVPLTTLWKYRTGETADPGLSKVRAFWPHIKAAASVDAARAPSAGSSHEHPRAGDRRTDTPHEGTVNLDRINDTRRSGEERRGR